MFSATVDSSYETLDLISFDFYRVFSRHHVAKKRKVFNIEKKSHIIWKLEIDESNECRVLRSTSTIWKNKDKIKDLFENNSLKLKRLKALEHKVI